MSEHRYIDGTPVTDGHRLKPAVGHIQTFTVSIRSAAAGPVGEHTLKSLIQSRYEVSHLACKEQTSYHPK